MLAALPLLLALTADAAPERPTTCGAHRAFTTVGRVGLITEAGGLGMLTVALLIAPAPELGTAGAVATGVGFSTAVVGGIGMAASARSDACALGKPGGLGAFGTFAIAGGLPVVFAGGLLFGTALGGDSGIYDAVGYVFGGVGILGGGALVGVGTWALVRHAIKLEQVAVLPDFENRGVRVVGRF